MAEKWITLLLTWKGAEVFPNAHSTGATDLVALIDGVLHRFDVKCSTYRKQGYWDNGHAHLVPDDVTPIIVYPDGDITNWRVSWAKGRAPEGLEGLWDNDNRTYTAAK